MFFDTGMPLATFSERMQARQVLVGRRFAPFDSWCRITIGTEPEVARVHHERCANSVAA